MSDTDHVGEQPTERGPGRIITFYSYKGGTGRSMALANTAWILASNRKRVLVVDWDLEAPGLHRYFHPFLLDKDLTSSYGVLDMIWEFSSSAMDPSGPDTPDWYAKYADVFRYATSIRWDFPGDGTVDLLSAGRQDATYSARVNAFDWTNFYDRLGGGTFLELVKQGMRKAYDYVLIDSRTGLSDTAGICTVQFPDTLVLAFTMNVQSMVGAAAVARSVSKQRTIRVLPVPMRVDPGETAKLEAARDQARLLFDDYLDELDNDQREQYWGEVEVPYRSIYAYEEMLASIGDRPRTEGTILAASERLVGYLTNGVIRQTPPLDESQRRDLIASYENGWPARLVAESTLPYTTIRYRDTFGRPQDSAIRPTSRQVVGADSTITMERVVDTNRRRLIRKSVPVSVGDANPWYYDHLDQEVLAGMTLAELYPHSYPRELARLVGYNLDIREPYALFEPYRGEPLSKQGHSLLVSERLELTTSLLRTLQLLHEAGLEHGNIIAESVYWDGQAVQLVDFEHCRLLSQDDSGSSAKDIRDAGALLVAIHTGETSSEPAGPVTSLGEPLRSLLENTLLEDPMRRPTAKALLASWGASPARVVQRDVQAPLRKGWLLFDQISQMKLPPEPVPGGTRRDISVLRPFVAGILLVLLLALVVVLLLINGGGS